VVYCSVREKTTQNYSTKIKKLKNYAANLGFDNTSGQVHSVSLVKEEGRGGVSDTSAQLDYTVPFTLDVLAKCNITKYIIR